MCVTIDTPWDLAVGGTSPGGDPALLVIEVPMDLFVRYEWVEEEKGYREALIPAEELNRYPVWPAWECVECGASAAEGYPGWHSELLKFVSDPERNFTPPQERQSTCPDCAR